MKHPSREMKMDVKHSGIVYLVGAGPGHPDLVTVRGTMCLGRADVVLYDYLVNPEILRYAREGVERICLGRHRRQDIWPQDKINQVMIDKAKEGKCVVRLKGGDPMIFGRAGEEIASLAAAQIPFEIVPGVTTASAAAAFSGVMLTDRADASAVALVTGQEQYGKAESSLDFRLLANFPGTLAIYMGVRSVREWTRALLDGGKSPSTPCLVARRCSWPDQQTLSCHLVDLPNILPQRMAPPVMVLIGEATRVREELAWFRQRPLFGHRVLVTRPRAQSAFLVDPLRDLGADVWVQPAIEIGPPTDEKGLDDALDRLSQFDWIVFSSRNGVEYFWGRLQGRGGDGRRLGNGRIAAVGTSTAEALRKLHLQPDLVPSDFHAEGLLAELRPFVTAGTRFLLVRASRGRDLLSQQLISWGGEVTEVAAYTSRDITELEPETRDWIGESGPFWVTVTSSAIARASARLLAPFRDRIQWASLSPISSTALRAEGMDVACEGVTHDASGLVAALVASVASGRQVGN